MPTVQRFYVMHLSGDVYEETLEPHTNTSIRVLMECDYVYDRLPDGTWTVMKDRTNGHWYQVMPSDEDLCMMILFL